MFVFFRGVPLISGIAHLEDEKDIKTKQFGLMYTVSRDGPVMTDSSRLQQHHTTSDDPHVYAYDKFHLIFQLCPKQMRQRWQKVVSRNGQSLRVGIKAPMQRCSQNLQHASGHILLHASLWQRVLCYGGLPLF